MRTSLICALMLWVWMASGCGKADPGESTPTPQPEATQGQGAAPALQHADHGDEALVGETTLAGFKLEVSRLGAIAPGSDAAVAVRVTEAPAGKDWRSLNMYVWIEDAEGHKLTAAEKTHLEKERLHAHASVPARETRTPANLVLRLRDGAVDESVRVPLQAAAGAAAGAPKQHAHEKTPHDGVVAAVRGAAGKQVAWLELKLHDDKGDLELWLGADKGLVRPLDLSLDATITVTFVDHAGKKVALAPRNRETNEDEEGAPNLRAGKTNYFIFPGETGADATWLKGAAFQSIVVVSVRDGERRLTSEELLLRPHTHAAGEGH